MLSLITYVSRFIFILLIVLFILFGWQCYKRLPSQKQAAPFAHSQQVLIALFVILADTIILLHTIQAEGDIKQCFLWLGIEAAGMLVMGILCETLHKGTGRLIWNCVFMLLAISIAILWRLKVAIAIKQIQWMLLCFVILQIVIPLMRTSWIYKIPVWLFILATVGFIALPFVLPYASGGAVNWAHIGGFIFQPSELAKITFIFMIGHIYSRKVSLKGLLLAGGMTAFIAMALLLQKDLGGVMIFGIVFWFMTYEYLDRKLWLILGLLIVCAGGFLAYKVFGHVRVRVNSWIDPWSDINRGGYQIAHSLFAIVGGGWFGTGLYQGIPTYIPVHTTDMIFAAIAEEFGVVFCIMLIVLYTFLFLTMLEYARHEGEAHKRALLLGFAVLFMSQTFVIIGGTTKLIPLTGVTLPFLSYGGTSLLSMSILIGIVQGIIRSSYPPVRKEVPQNEIPQQPYPGPQFPYAGPNAPYQQPYGQPNAPYQQPYGQPGSTGRGNEGTPQGNGQDTIRTPYRF